MVNLLLAGLLAGLVAAFVMGIVSQGLLRDQPMPAALFASEFLTEDPPEESRGLGWVVHLTYGTLAGGLFAVVATLLGGVGDMGAMWLTGYGLTWGLLLWLVAGLWLAVLGLREMQRARRSERMVEGQVMLLTHAVYGLVLGFVTALLTTPPAWIWWT